MIVLKDIKKTYYGKNIETNVLKGVDLMIHPGEFVCIYGSSGSGKSTLLNIVGVLDYATEGEYTLDGISIKNLNDKKMAEIRNRKIGLDVYKRQILWRQEPKKTLVDTLDISKDKQYRTCLLYTSRSEERSRDYEINGRDIGVSCGKENEMVNQWN